jgi:N6-adenosine-specific RNA methylase IME4
MRDQSVDRNLLRRLPAALRIEIEENIRRKNFTESELAAIQNRLIAELSRPEMKRQGKRTDLTCTAGERTSSKHRQNVTERVARLFGEAEQTVRKRLALMDAAEAEPEQFGKLLADMDRTGRVNAPYKRLRNIRQAEQIRAEPPPLPGRGPYRVGTCDVPWPSEADDSDPSDRAYWPFPTMSIAELCALDVASIMHADSVFWFWTTNFHMCHAYTVLDAWGFPLRPTILTWIKDRPGRGQRLRGQTEHCIMAVRGNPTITLTNQTTALHAPVRPPLGSKPREFYDLVESLCPAPRYADLFSRYRHNERWDCHGDEAPAYDADADVLAEGEPSK